MIDKLPRTSAVAELARSLVGRDLELFLHLLSHKELECVRLNPLCLDYDLGPMAENVVHEFDDGWLKMAIAAMEKGFSEKDVFCATQSGSYGWSGSMSSMYASRLAPFEKLLKHENARLRKIGK